MTRYHFEIRDGGGVYSDQEGIEFEEGMEFEEGIEFETPAVLATSETLRSKSAQTKGRYFKPASSSTD